MRFPTLFNLNQLFHKSWPLPCFQLFYLPILICDNILLEKKVMITIMDDRKLKKIHVSQLYHLFFSLKLIYSGSPFTVSQTSVQLCMFFLNCTVFCVLIGCRSCQSIYVPCLCGIVCASYQIHKYLIVSRSVFFSTMMDFI